MDEIKQAVDAMAGIVYPTQGWDKADDFKVELPYSGRSQRRLQLRSEIHKVWFTGENVDSETQEGVIQAFAHPDRLKVWFYWFNNMIASIWITPFQSSMPVSQNMK